MLVGNNTASIFANAGLPYSLSELPEFFEKGIIAYDNGYTDDQLHKRIYYMSFDEQKADYGSLFAPIAINANGKVFATVADDIRKSGDTLATVIPYGKGNVAVIGFDIGSQYLEAPQYTYRKLLDTLLSTLYTEKVKVESVCGSLEIVDLVKDGKLMIQLVNGGGSHADLSSATDDRIFPALDIELSIALDEKPTALMLRPEGRKLDFEWRDGRAYTRIDRVDIHSIIEVIE